MDKITGEYTKNDEEHTIQTEHISNHGDKIEDHESRIASLE